MRRFSPAVLVGAFLSFPLAVCAQQAQQSTQPVAPVRDQQAIAILTQVLNASGGVSAVAAIQDFTATGNITYYWVQPVQGTATVRGRGLHELRVDVSLPDGPHSSITTATTSIQKNPDGTTSTLPSQNTRKPAVATFPLVLLFNAIQDVSVSVTYEGLILHNGQKAHEVVVQNTFATGGDPAGVLGSISKAHLFIDPNSLTVQSIEDTAYRKDGGPGDYPHEIQFSGYQSVKGVLVPFSVRELIAGQQTLIIQLSQVKFNTGLTDSDFQ